MSWVVFARVQAGGRQASYDSLIGDVAEMSRGIEGSVFGIEGGVWLTRKEKAAESPKNGMEILPLYPAHLRRVNENDHTHSCENSTYKHKTHASSIQTPLSPHPPNLFLLRPRCIHSEESQMTPSPSVCPHASNDVTSSLLHEHAKWSRQKEND